MDGGPARGADDPHLREAAAIIAAVVGAAEAGEAVAIDSTVQIAPGLCEGRRVSREECFVASVDGVGPGEDGADACLTVKVEAMPVGEAVEHRTPVARSVILDADGADPDALAAEAERAGRLLQGRFVETLMRTFGLPGEGEAVEAEAFEPGARA